MQLQASSQPLLNQQDIAQQVGMSTSSLQRHFRNNFHLSVTQYHRQQRLRRALHSLQKDQISINQAAELAGYSTTGNFSTAVKKEFGVTPKQLQSKF
ncbi:MAG: helix-turn-helix transcriptional regulator [Pseudomonas sp.]|nr:helix-turn-helix transcriptional regulator [Pseudomonas sp.]